MSTVTEIQEAASRLGEAEQESLLYWLLERESQWDKRIERDAAAGKLNFLAEQAKAAIREGTLRNWPGRP